MGPAATVIRVTWSLACSVAGSVILLILRSLGFQPEQYLGFAALRIFANEEASFWALVAIGAIAGAAGFNTLYWLSRRWHGHSSRNRELARDISDTLPNTHTDSAEVSGLRRDVGALAQLLTSYGRYVDDAPEIVERYGRIEGSVLPPEQWSSLKYGFDQGGRCRWQGRGILRKRS